MPEKVIGITKVGVNWQITLLREVAEKLKARVGDKLMYLEVDGEIVIRKV